MRLEPWYRIRFTYPEGWVVGLEGGWEQHLFLAEGRCEGSISGRFRGANFPQRRIGNTRRVGSHVSDQTDRTFVAQFNAFVKFLGQHHRLLHRKAEFAGCFLLKFRGDEWRNWIAFSFLGGNVVDDE